MPLVSVSRVAFFSLFKHCLHLWQASEFSGVSFQSRYVEFTHILVHYKTAKKNLRMVIG